VKIPIQNLYYLLCFAWNRVPQEMAFDVSTIPASADVLELCSYLLITGTDLLLRRGLDRGYLLHEERTARVRGRINMTQTLKSGVSASPQVVCQFDDLSRNVLHNQILRASIEALSHADRVNSELKNSLRTAYGKLSGIDRIEVTSGMFGQVQLHRNNRYYAFLLFICRLVHTLKLPDHGSGHSRFKDLISDEKVMEKVFEEFLRNFYRLKQRQFHSSDCFRS
jgi:5-methylcytosine-specific restriction enzyme subunit McrC